jgi:DNA-binding LacI/PurR family transcriptional regulator
MQVTLADIARRAGVSLQAVSAVVNRGRSTSVVGAKTRQKIERVAAELGYIPNSGAQSIRRGRFNRVAFVVTRYFNAERKEKSRLRVSYLEETVDRLADHGYSVIYEPFDLDFATLDFIEPPRLFQELAVDGIIAIDCAGVVPPQVDQRVSDRRCPVVWVNRGTFSQETSTVQCDERAGATILVEHLRSLGHRRIGYLTYPSVHYSKVEREAGVIAALQAACLPTDAVHLIPPGATAAELACRVVREQAVTAVICYDYLTYLGSLHGLAAMGVRVPADVSLCLFAGCGERDSTVPLTCVEVPEPAMSEAAVELLVARMADRSAPPQVRRFPGVFLPGNTTGRAPSDAL